MGQSGMDKPEILATLGREVTEQRKTKNTTQKT